MTDVQVLIFILRVIGMQFPAPGDDEHPVEVDAPAHLEALPRLLVLRRHVAHALPWQLHFLIDGGTPWQSWSELIGQTAFHVLEEGGTLEDRFERCADPGLCAGDGGVDVCLRGEGRGGQAGGGGEAGRGRGQPPCQRERVRFLQDRLRPEQLTRRWQESALVLSGQ